MALHHLLETRVRVQAALNAQVLVEFVAHRSVLGLALAEELFHFAAQIFRQRGAVAAMARDHLAGGLVGERLQLEITHLPGDRLRAFRRLGEFLLRRLAVLPHLLFERVEIVADGFCCAARSFNAS
ncbi:MAG: hypothetical protein WDN28_08405 [Chthoniobacter sp.]